VAEVEVDPDTGLVRILRYVVAHDCGTLINPLLVEGQVQGAVAHGIGNALMEKMRFDEAANPLTTMMGEYLLPDAESVPEVEQVHLVSPSPLNPLGVKGAGEGGTLPSPAAIISAVEDALRDFDVRIRELPILPERLCQLIDAGGTPTRAGSATRPRAGSTGKGQSGHSG
jgi:carbon-monoxide dehydrogenase large subunit